MEDTPERRSPPLSVRWTRDLFFIASLFVISLSLLVVLTYQGMFILDGIRAYANGESHWSKARRDAFFHLTLYAHLQDEVWYEGFQDSLAVPLASSRARLELKKPEPERSVVYQNLLAARNDRQDVENMARLYFRFGRTPYMAEAINVWSEADTLLAQTERIAERLHAAIGTDGVDSEFMEDFWRQFGFLQRQFSLYEEHFARMLAEGGRTTKVFLMRVFSGTALLLLGIGVFLSGWIIRRMKESSVQLRRLNGMLEQRVADRTSMAEERTRQLELLAMDLTHAEQRERRRLAHCLHDNLQQLIAAARMRANTLLRCRIEESKGKESVVELSDLLELAMDASRSLTVELSPPILYESGLPSGIEWLGLRMKESHGLTVEMETIQPVEPISSDLRAFLFQTVRELLFNVVKYAGVDRAKVLLDRFTEGEREVVSITVSDRGIGFSSEEASAAVAGTGGFGLVSIRERLGWLGGRMKIDSTRGRGTEVTVFVPVAAGEWKREDG